MGDENAMILEGTEDKQQDLLTNEGNSEGKNDSFENIDDEVMMHNARVEAAENLNEIRECMDKNDIKRCNEIITNSEDIVKKFENLNIEANKKGRKNANRDQMCMG